MKCVYSEYFRTNRIDFERVKKVGQVGFEPGATGL